MTKHAEGILFHLQNTNLHHSNEVEVVADYLRATGESIPNEPAAKLEAHLGFLASKDYVNDGILTGDKTSIDRQIDARVIKAEDVPESYFELQRRIAREQGHGDVEISEYMHEQLVKAVQADQRAGLGKWVEYLGGEDGGYPDWFKAYTWNSVVKLGSFDKEKGEFGKRSKGTTAPYPDLNREALAYTYTDIKDKLYAHKFLKDSKDPVSKAETKDIEEKLKQTNFAKFYVHALKEVSPTDPELLANIEGSWTKFNQTDDPRTARRLSESLQGHGTGWCTAGEETAAWQLEGGDFYVYYTQDEKGKDSVPRVAIRMEDGQVAEVRGINQDQELEPALITTAEEQLVQLPGGNEYFQIAQDMKRLTKLEKLLTTDVAEELSDDDILFLYETEKMIWGFGYGRDPRIDELKLLAANVHTASALERMQPDGLATSQVKTHVRLERLTQAITADSDYIPTDDDLIFLYNLDDELYPLDEEADGILVDTIIGTRLPADDIINLCTKYPDLVDADNVMMQAKNTIRLDQISTKVNQNEQLNGEDLLFLYGYEGSTQGLPYVKAQKVRSRRVYRDRSEDWAVLSETLAQSDDAKKQVQAEALALLGMVANADKEPASPQALSLFYSGSKRLMDLVPAKVKDNLVAISRQGYHKEDYRRIEEAEMNQLTSIAVKTNGGDNLDVDELKLLYEVNSRMAPASLGLAADIISSRPIKADIEHLLELSPKYEIFRDDFMQKVKVTEALVKMYKKLSHQNGPPIDYRRINFHAGFSVARLFDPYTQS